MSPKCKDRCKGKSVSKVDISKLSAKRAHIKNVHTKTIKAHKISVKQDLCNRRVITKKDFLDCETLTLSKTFVIEEEGNYILGENIEFEAVSEEQNTIQILADNVCLDLCCNFIKQVNDVENVTGIRLGLDDGTLELKNITIRNGSILNMTGQGIGAFSSIIIDEEFQNILLEDLNVLECGVSTSSFFASGINFESSAFSGQDQVVAYRNITIRRCKVNDCLGNGAIQVFTADGVVIQECQGNNLTKTTTSFSFSPFALAVFGRNMQIEDSQFNNTQALGAFTFNSGSLICSNSKNIQVRNCQFNESGGNAQTAGSFSQFVQNLFVENTQFNGAFGTVTATDGAQIAGLFSGQGSDHQFLNCQFNNTNVANDNAFYSIVQGNNPSITDNAVYENCQFNNTSGRRVFELAGIHMSDLDFQPSPSEGMKFINCQFNNIVGREDGFYGLIHGFGAITQRDVSFEHCEAINIRNENTELNNLRVVGFFVTTFLPDVVPEVGSIRNVLYRNTIARDIVNLSSADTTATAGISMAVTDSVSIIPSLGSGSGTNFVIDNCIAERIHSNGDNVEGIFIGLSLGSVLEVVKPPVLSTAFVRNCRVSDVRSFAENPDRNAGILIDSVLKPVLCNNSVSCCDKGILMTGSDNVDPNAFQVALTQQDALADPPIFIDLGTVGEVKVTLNPDPMGLGPIAAFYTTNGPRLVAPFVATGVITNPTNACSPLINGGAVSGNMGVVLRDGACNSSTFVLNVQNAGANSCLILSNEDNATTFGGFGGQTIPAVVVNFSDGVPQIAQSITNNPGTQVTLTPVDLLLQTFDNVTQGNSINVESVVDTTDFVVPEQNLTTLGWQPGDQLTYNCNGTDPIPGLVCGQTYYTIVYEFGFARNGLIQENKVDNCSISGYEDDNPQTENAWINNVALLNGTPSDHGENYNINWQGVPQVDEGTLAQYPLDPNKYYNLSLIQ